MKKTSPRSSKSSVLQEENAYFHKSSVLQIWCRNDSKWGPVTAWKSKKMGLWCSLKFISILVHFYEYKTTPNGDPKKWSGDDFSMLWAQPCPKAPQRVHLGSKTWVFFVFWGMFLGCFHCVSMHNSCQVQIPSNDFWAFCCVLPAPAGPLIFSTFLDRQDGQQHSRLES